MMPRRCDDLSSPRLKQFAKTKFTIDLKSSQNEWQIAHSVGVTHEPEVVEVDLDARMDVMLVLASDGVWDVLSADDIRKVKEDKQINIPRVSPSPAQ